jgi:hypothetical protein
LRAERQAAEKLAEQRVQQARGKSGDRPHQPPVNVTANQNQRPAPKAPEKPKFSFSPEELAKDKREQVPPEREFPTFSSKSSTATPPPPLTPPRPALGGTPAQAQQPPQPRQPIQAPPVRQPPPKPAAANPPAGAGFQPRFNGPAQPLGGNYRSLDPPPGGAFSPKPKPYADTAFRDDPLAQRPANREYDSYRRGLPQAPQPAYGDDSGPSLSDYRRRQQVPARTRQPAYDEDVNEVFEDEEPQRPQRRRASAQDYNRAYRDYEDGYDTDTPRRRGPWPWLLAILLGGVLITGGMIYYYLNYYKQSGPAAGNVPVIEAPEQGAKTAPEPSSGSTLGTQGSTQPDATDKTKQIYDRILGDDEAGGNQVVPTQEEPQVVEPTGSNEGQNTAPVPDQPSGDNANDPLPLPLPPPGEQGSLPSNASQQTAALGTTATNKVEQSVPEPASTTTADTGTPVPGQLPKASEQADTPPPQADTSPPQIEQIVTTPEPVPEKPVKPKARAEKKPVKKVAAAEAVDDVGAGQNNGVEPLVLVPPAQSGNAEAQTPSTQIAQPDVDVAANPETAQPADEKSKSFFGFGSTKRKLTGKAAEQANAQGAAGNWANSPDPNATVPDAGGAPAPLPEQQVASVAPEPIPLPAPEPTPQQAKPAAGGFVAQLASFRTEAEAMAEYDRLRAKHGNVLSGLSPRVVKATIGGSPRYRLGVGPLASRSAALKICNSLISAGERDCLVRGN